MNKQKYNFITYEPEFVEGEKPPERVHIFDEYREKIGEIQLDERDNKSNTLFFSSSILRISPQHMGEIQDLQGRIEKEISEEEEEISKEGFIYVRGAYNVDTPIVGEIKGTDKVNHNNYSLFIDSLESLMKKYKIAKIDVALNPFKMIEDDF